MESIQKLGIAEIEKLNGVHNFISHEKTGKGASLEETNTSFDKSLNSFDNHIMDGYFGSTLNANRQIQIGSTIWQAGNDFSFSVPSQKVNKIKEVELLLASNANSLNIPESGKVINEVFVFPTHFTLKIVPAKSNVVQSRGIDFWNTHIINYQYFDGEWRLHGEAWRANWGVYSSVGVKSECNKVSTFLDIGYYSFAVASSLGISYTGCRVNNLYINGYLVTGSSCEQISYNRTDALVDNVYKLIDFQTATVGYGNNSPPQLTTKEIHLTTTHSGNYWGIVRQFSMTVDIQ